MPAKSRRPTEAQVREAVLDDLGEDPGLVVAATSFGCANIVGVCRLVMDVQIKSSRSVFQPVERIVSRTIGQMFLLICRQPAKDHEDFTPKPTDLVWAESVERESGAIVAIVTSVDDAREQLRNRGLPV